MWLRILLNFDSWIVDRGWWIVNRGSWFKRRITNHESRITNHGFTLIEVLVAVSLISVIMLLIWQTTGQTINAKQRIEKRDEIYHNVRVAVDKMVQDISMAFLLGNQTHFGQRQGSPQLKTIFKGEADELHFASLSHLRLFQNAKESSSCEIGYKIEQDPEDRELFRLLRREAKWVDDKPEEGGVWFSLAEKVKKLKFEYYDGRKFDWQSSWNTESDTGLKLPRAVKIVIDFQNPDDPDEDISIATIALVGMHGNAIDF